MRIAQATTGAELDAVRTLMAGFVEWHYDRHSEYRDLIDRYFDMRTFQAELAGLPGVYAPPRGRLLLACDADVPAGCVALRDIGGGSCEMKRMFVHPDYHGKGLGRALAEAIIAEATTAGYNRMLLDTGPKQREAQGLYRQLGFVEADPYYDLEDEMRNWLVFMELNLPN
ncbi:GNAT family N-acetyltransferase [Psychromarinibacter halotolerans]|uniref:GNAT family N-acetyltransferase n=1 Tax=Psychromarinibacter halotolerans TaxID=1775175 RepID=A0ABV7GNQ1_9RHOB|nr:GNAT family N-acetyltransferase [Psychromarinibacter halotolerans]MDF0596758.1 GNAT family N-acetyltransferase [Psychromarinibacter halotolerans]